MGANSLPRWQRVSDLHAGANVYNVRRHRRISESAHTRYFAGFGGSGQAVAGRTYDVSADGKRFLMVKENATGEPAATSLVVVLNLGEELRKRAPAGGSR
jgi:hypothetical protein